MAKEVYYDSAAFKATELFSKNHSTVNVYLWGLNGSVLDFLHLLEKGVAETPELKGFPLG